MYCKNCGAKNADNALFCCSCGKPMDGGSDSGNKMEWNAKKKKNTMLWLIPVLILVIAAVAAAFILAQRAVSKMNQDKKTEMDSDTEKEKKTEGPEKQQQKYTWYLEPSVEAEDINCLNYTGGTGMLLNEMGKQVSDPLCVMKDGSGLYLISYEGQLKTKACSFLKYWFDAYCGSLVEPMDQGEFTDWTDFFYENGQVNLGLVFGDAGDKSHGQFDGVVLYKDGMLIERRYGQDGPAGALNTPMGVLQVQGDDVFGTGKYAIAKDGRLITDFIYEECGAFQDGLIAVKKNGKWGYLDKDGKEVIPFSYDASWKQFYQTAVLNREDSEYQNIEFRQIDFAYGASGGYVVLCRDGRYSLADTRGREVIPENEFEAIRPVYEGKCWVKQHGKWGVICLEEQEDATEKDRESKPEKTAAPEGTQKPAASQAPTQSPQITQQIPQASVDQISAISATSSLTGDGYPHGSDLAVDGNLQTGWSEGAPGNGVGEGLNITFSQTMRLAGIRIANGYQKSGELYDKNARVASLILTYSDGTTETLAVADVTGVQNLTLSQPKETDSLQIRIGSVYEGSKYEDTVISEISFF